MTCARCNHLMMSTHRVEVENAGEQVFFRKVLIHECPECSVEVIIIAPIMFQPLEDH